MIQQCDKCDRYIYIYKLYIYLFFIYMHAIRYVAFVDFRKKKFQSGFQVMFKLQLDISQLYKYIPWGYIFQKQLEVWPNWEKHSCYCDFYIASLCSGQGWCCSLHLSVFLQLYSTCWVSRPDLLGVYVLTLATMGLHIPGRGLLGVGMLGKHYLTPS